MRSSQYSRVRLGAWTSAWRAVAGGAQLQPTLTEAGAMNQIIDAAGSDSRAVSSRSVPTRLLRQAVSTLALALVLACGRGGDPSDQPKAGGSEIEDAALSVAEPELVDIEAFQSGFEIARHLELEESDRAMVVSPFTAVAGPDRLILSEPKESQVNIYSTDGSLLRVIGRRGDGPGEFSMPVMARPTADGGIVVADLMVPRMTFFPEDGDPVTVASPGLILMGVSDIGGDRYLIEGRSEEHWPAQLHIWNRGTETIERSFLPAAVPEAALQEAVRFISISAHVEADTIWAAWSLSDTVYRFDLNGELLDRLPVALPTPIVLPTTPYERRSEAEMKEVEGITQIEGVFPAGGELAVQSQRKVTAGTIYDLVLMDRQGSLVWSAPRMPKLHAVIGADFYFADPFSILPNRWIVARRKAED